MGLRRRDFFTFLGGGVAGLAVTPVPWKLLDDTAIWTQNWSWIPTPARGELTTRFTTCSLCPAACGIKARCVNGQPISLAGVPSLCAVATGAHQLPYHPARVKQAVKNGSPIATETAIAELRDRAKASNFAIVDERPGRTATTLYQQCGRCVAPRNPEAATLEYVAAAAGIPAHQLGLALEDVDTIVSFGAPLLESWATPSRVLNRWRDKKLRIIQVEPVMSPTAALASKWVRSLEELREQLRTGSVVAVSSGTLPPAAEQAVAQLNFTLGSRAFVKKQCDETYDSFDAVADGSLDLLLVDHGPLGGRVPPSVLRSKLRKGGILASITPYDAGAATSSDYVLPAPAFLEAIDDWGTSWDATKPCYSVAPALLPKSVPTAVETIAAITGKPVDLEAAMKQRVADLHTGEVFIYATGERKPIKDFESPDKLWEAFAAGASWTDSAAAVDSIPLKPATVQIAKTALQMPAVLPPLYFNKHRRLA